MKTILFLIALLFLAACTTAQTCPENTLLTNTCGPTDAIIETCEPILPTEGLICTTKADCSSYAGMGECMLSEETRQSECVDNICGPETRGTCSQLEWFYAKGWRLHENRAYESIGLICG